MPPQTLHVPPGTVLALSVIHVFMGLLSLLTGMFISFEGVLKPERTGALELWTGPFFVVTGGMGFVAARASRRTDVINHLALSVISCCCSGLLIFGGSLLTESSVVNGKDVGYSEPHIPLTVFGIIELITSVMSIIVCLHVMRASHSGTQTEITCKATGEKVIQKPESFGEPNDSTSSVVVGAEYSAKLDYVIAQVEPPVLSVSKESEPLDTDRLIQDKNMFPGTAHVPAQCQDVSHSRDQVPDKVPQKTSKITADLVCSSENQKTLQGQVEQQQNTPTTPVQIKTTTKICRSSGKPVVLAEKSTTEQWQADQRQNIPRTPTIICKSTGRPIALSENAKTVQRQAETESCRNQVVCPFNESDQANCVFNRTDNNRGPDSSSLTERNSSSETLELEDLKDSTPASKIFRPDTPEPGMNILDMQNLNAEPENRSINLDLT